MSSEYETNQFKIDLVSQDIMDISLDHEKNVLQTLYQVILARLEENQLITENQMKDQFEILYKEEVDKLNQIAEKNCPNYVYATMTLESIGNLLTFLNEKYLLFLEQQDQEISCTIGKSEETMFNCVKKLVGIIMNLYPLIENEMKRLYTSNNIRYSSLNKNDVTENKLTEKKYTSKNGDNSEKINGEENANENKIHNEKDNGDTKIEINNENNEPNIDKEKKEEDIKQQTVENKNKEEEVKIEENNILKTKSKKSIREEKEIVINSKSNTEKDNEKLKNNPSEIENKEKSEQENLKMIPQNNNTEEEVLKENLMKKPTINEEEKKEIIENTNENNNTEIYKHNTNNSKINRGIPEPYVQEKENIVDNDNEEKIRKELEMKYQALYKKEKEELSKQYEDEITMYQTKIEQLKSENDMLTQKLLQNAKTIIKNNFNQGEMKGQKSEPYFQSFKNSGSSSNFLFDQKRNRSMKSFDPENTNQFCFAGNRIFTLKMMKDVIHEIYNSKKDFNQKCDQSQQPRETLEQYMYTFLNHKYGLKSLIIEWASNIIKGIRSFSAEDAEVCLFGKILRNEIEEDATLFLPMLKNNIMNKLLDEIKKKNPLKSLYDCTEIRDEKINSGLLYEECIEIVTEFYDKDDSAFLQKKVFDLINKKKNYSQNNQKVEKVPERRKKLTRDELLIIELQKEEIRQTLTFNEFLNLLLECQIKAREKYLKNFLTAFRKVDTDNNGILNEDEFIQLIYDLNLGIEDISDFINRILSIIDPYNNKSITFSECVSLFGSETIDNGEGEVYILDKIYTKNNPSTGN